ncbi:Methyltransferase domain-containing protein [Tenacibaculum sp. MAR_2009_124]|uniref:class I SAM-dependent DNA methyltransferase n=1 Tax=Tenacibaculum sp. MAR_2009_124 TaxID=1250059 RepID=UPI00089D6780|nr:class I SAM-dependent methyltransferase [Tenacibaculum sp. MAR_2009_124]SEB36298.1 Methyltransferase domain-containing protein [Tenacibaculum sp. MAR_2009_124]
MSNLYNDLAEVYEAMYATFIDYKLEYELYESFLDKFNKKKLLEIGCGTGSLAKHFIRNNYEYCGLDMSADMLKIAKEKNPNTPFVQGDMRSFKLANQIESVLITGRTISYLVENNHVLSSFKCIHNVLTEKGLFCFDFIDANEFIPYVNKTNSITHKAEFKNKNYIRKSIWEPNILSNWHLNWSSTYYEEQQGNLIEIGKDSAKVRAFTKDEILLFLNLTNFKVNDIFKRKTYAFPTYMVIAEKVI